MKSNNDFKREHGSPRAVEVSIWEWIQYASMPLSETLNLKLSNKQIKMLINSGQEKSLEAWKD